MEVQRLLSGDETLAHHAVAILKVGKEELRSRLTREYFRRFLSRSENYLIVAMDEGTPVGLLLAYELDRVDRDQTMMFFYEVGVAESHRGRGVAKAMIALLKEICRRRNVMKMYVFTNRSNTAAMRLYESTGGKADPSGDEVSFLYTPETFCPVSSAADVKK